MARETHRKLPPTRPTHALPRLATFGMFAWCTPIAACIEGSSAVEAPGGRLQLEVAPLNLPSIDEACYAIEVANDASGASLVFAEPKDCSTSFGDGKGALTYVGSCDAQTDADGATPGVQNRVELRLTSLSSTTGDLVAGDDYINPCGNDQCVQYVTCLENADTPVTFNLTILRDADQGFFDIAVSFSDVFCSAKADCRSAFLFNDANTRGPTGIIALACTAGDSGATHMVLDDISFNGRSYDVNASEGNQDSSPSAAGENSRSTRTRRTSQATPSSIGPWPSTSPVRAGTS